MYVYHPKKFSEKLGTQNMFSKELSVIISTVSEFNEFEPRLKSAKNRFQLSAGLYLKKMEYKFKWNQPYLSRGLN